MFFLIVMFVRIDYSNIMTPFLKYGYIIPGYDHVSKTIQLLFVQWMWTFEHSDRTDLLIVSLSITELLFWNKRQQEWRAETSIWQISSK